MAKSFMSMTSVFAPRTSGRRGTTLLEVLVVIVIFLLGILAIVQIFPYGFKILMSSRNSSVSKIGRAHV